MRKSLEMFHLSVKCLEKRNIVSLVSSLSFLTKVGNDGGSDSLISGFQLVEYFKKIYFSFFPIFFFYLRKEKNSMKIEAEASNNPNPLG